jgi:toxin YoeB
LDYKIEISSQAKKDLRYWLKQDWNKLRKIFQLVEAIADMPFEGIGDPEPLKHDLQGYWSRRIDLEHRLLYYVKGNKIFIHCCKGHYD